MSKELAVEKFRLWLPDELEYSAIKAGSDKKIKRAGLPLDDPQSMYGFLGEEWFQFQQRHEEGINYLPFHGKSAQLQLAKLAAGLFDKAAVCNWIRSGNGATRSEFVQSARTVGSYVISTRPWESAEPLDPVLPFALSPVSKGIAELMTDIVLLVNDPQNREIGDRLFDLTIGLGARVAATYGEFAAEFLTEEQYVLPVSELAPK